MAGQALTATELADIAGVTKQTISAHLAKLVDAELVAVESQGRHRYFRLADRDVAHLLESLMGVAFRTGAVRARPSPREPALRKARVCSTSRGRDRCGPLRGSGAKAVASGRCRRCRGDARDGRFEIKTANNGFDAGMLVKEFRPDLVVLDIMLPDINGKEVCQRVRADDTLEQVKIICISGMVEQDKVADLRAAGADDFLQKPFTVDKLVDRAASCSRWKRPCWRKRRLRRQIGRPRQFGRGGGGTSAASLAVVLLCEPASCRWRSRPPEARAVLLRPRRPCSRRSALENHQGPHQPVGRAVVLQADDDRGPGPPRRGARPEVGRARRRRPIGRSSRNTASPAPSPAATASSRAGTHKENWDFCTDSITKAVNASADFGCPTRHHLFRHARQPARGRRRATKSARRTSSKASSASCRWPSRRRSRSPWRCSTRASMSR